MTPNITITGVPRHIAPLVAAGRAGVATDDAGVRSVRRHEPPRKSSGRGLAMLGTIAVAFGLVGGQLVRLAATSQQPTVSIAASELLSRTHARPDIVDRSGRLIASDLIVHSLYADPAMVLDADVVSEKLTLVLPELDPREVRESLSDRTRRFVWLRRGLPPALAQQVHDLGLPGLGFRRELRRVYPLGRLGGHVVGHVNIDNKGVSGIERHIDEAIGIEPLTAVAAGARDSVRLTLDIGAQAAVEDALAAAMERFQAKGAAGVVLDANDGAVVAAASLPGVDPARPVESQDPARFDKIMGGSYELGSVFKAMTIAMALDRGQARIDTLYDVRQPLKAGRYMVRDLHPSRQPLSVAEIFLHSSNVGAGLIALDSGAGVQRTFLSRLGLLDALGTEAGNVAPPQLPERWDEAQTITISYGHGLAVAPLQFTAAAAALINGGVAVKPRFLQAAAEPGAVSARPRVISAATSRRMRELMRLNVTSASGTGRRADVPGYEVGGKTGTAEMPGKGGYSGDKVIASFLAAFPMSAPRYVAYVMLFEPKGTKETNGRITAGYNAAATAGDIIGRIAPLLGIAPARP